MWNLLLRCFFRMLVSCKLSYDQTCDWPKARFPEIKSEASPRLDSLPRTSKISKFLRELQHWCEVYSESRSTSWNKRALLRIFRKSHRNGNLNNPPHNPLEFLIGFTSISRMTRHDLGFPEESHACMMADFCCFRILSEMNPDERHPARDAYSTFLQKHGVAWRGRESPRRKRTITSGYAPRVHGWLPHSSFCVGVFRACGAHQWSESHQTANRTTSPILYILHISKPPSRSDHG